MRLASSQGRGETETRLEIRGNSELLKAPLLGLLCSRECPGHVILETLDLVPTWVACGRVVISGFHSPLEQQVLLSLLRRDGRAVKLLARRLNGVHVSAEECSAMDSGRLAVASAFGSSITRVTRQTAAARNQLVASMASEIVIPFARAGSPLEAIRLATSSKMGA